MVDFPLDPPHIRHAKTGLTAAGIPFEAGLAALNLARECYLVTPQVSQTDAMRRERNRIQDELKTVSSQLQQERRKTRQLEEALAAALNSPKAHQKKAYRLRKRLRAILAVLQHPQAKETTKRKSIAQLVTGALAGEEDPAPEELA